MSVAFSLQGALAYPPASGQPAASRPFSVSGNFDSKAEAELVLTGSGTATIGFGTVLLAKAILVSVQLSAVLLKLNGSDEGIEVAAGGFLAYSNPTPDVGIESLDIDYTADAKIQVYILG